MEKTFVWCSDIIINNEDDYQLPTIHHDMIDKRQIYLWIHRQTYVFCNFPYYYSPRTRRAPGITDHVFTFRFQCAFQIYVDHTHCKSSCVFVDESHRSDIRNDFYLSDSRDYLVSLFTTYEITNLCYCHRWSSFDDDSEL